MTINCNGNLIDLSVPKVMGILNLTPNSFYDGNKYTSDVEILSQAEKLLSEGAFCIDIGAYSTKPNAEYVSIDEEKTRLFPVLEKILKEFNPIISVDTFRSEIASDAINIGVAIINDISGGTLDDNMYNVVAKHNVPYILMHIKGEPKTMQNLTEYNNLLTDISYYFSGKIVQLREKGVNDIILDVGFGFAKTLAQNYELLHQLAYFKWLNLPLMVGVSRKSMIYKLLNASPQEALNGTSVLHTLSLNNGANILRAHDVKEAIECIKIMEEYNKYE